MMRASWHHELRGAGIHISASVTFPPSPPTPLQLPRLPPRVRPDGQRQDALPAQPGRRRDGGRVPRAQHGPTRFRRRGQQLERGPLLGPFRRQQHGRRGPAHPPRHRPVRADLRGLPVRVMFVRRPALMPAHCRRWGRGGRVSGLSTAAGLSACGRVWGCCRLRHILFCVVHMSTSLACLRVRPRRLLTGRAHPSLPPPPLSSQQSRVHGEDRHVPGVQREHRRPAQAGQVTLPALFRLCREVPTWTCA